MQLVDKKRVLFLLNFIVPFLTGVVILVGCSVHVTFRGASIPDNVRSASVQYFDNRAAVVNPLLSQTFTEGLKDRISGESRLNIVDDMGDVDFSGEITGYEIRPMAIQSDAVAAETRLTLTVRVRYRNFQNPDDNWESTFSAYEDFPSDRNITAIEDELVSALVDQLTENIFNRAFSDW
ncbi:LptE family protein [Marinilabiliaceae bacterium ANBcel2]|nr:LptE family protein [Marinilabiliaceae bacterium ANBcel2]